MLGAFHPTKNRSTIYSHHGQYLRGAEAVGEGHLGDSQAKSHGFGRGYFHTVPGKISPQQGKVCRLPERSAALVAGKEENRGNIYSKQSEYGKVFCFQGNPGIRAHAARIMKVFQAAVDAFDSADPEGHLQQVWTKVAVTHSNHEVQKDAFNELRAVVLEVMTDLCGMDQEQQEAWGVLFDVVYAIVFEKLDTIYGN